MVKNCKRSRGQIMKKKGSLLVSKLCISELECSSGWLQWPTFTTGLN
jgi:hypothetical protein